MCEVRGGDKRLIVVYDMLAVGPCALYPLKHSTHVESLVIFLMLLLSYINNCHASIYFVPLVFTEVSEKKSIYLLILT